MVYMEWEKKIYQIILNMAGINKEITLEELKDMPYYKPENVYDIVNRVLRKVKNAKLIENGMSGSIGVYLVINDEKILIAY